ncbi:MAG: chromosome segregation protein SMC [Candidatus Parvarchaeota archaeon]|nr:chromosome segregation protein SMC [Candidatus Jingweiarchaeum tengchongense]MCW1298441.1 chromosome segregation protein SMC [Candidatus Jingweiarchaeum tengchongense]MCW1300533.1 chromosome segregation protein SMC [Candidatus Jingweiarchaeum tengchongense]MCW1304992.1 chromosome segregation protein SMC [Candidatus Jingweiarchaeum tengchongense]MCW1306012.1 chromosome segregation protein SMC [Candidatus Jingweiarchaeum tengchongense]
MAYIKSLEMQGFKSFASRIKLNFSRGMSCITGPNGSGKSNIVEAICFVLGKGRKKELRTEKFAHLIFNGAKKATPAKFAKVTITLDNSEKEFPYNESEIKISRKVDQKDRVSYRINGVRATKAEVINLLKYANIDPEGFNIILQNEISKFAEMDPISVREIIEEISGIKVYDEKKEKSLNELKKVEEKINEANAHLAERDRYLKDLIEDKKKAEDYVKLNEELKVCNARLIFKEMSSREKEIKEILDKIFLRENKIKHFETKINEIDEKIRAGQSRLDKIEMLIKERGEEEQIKLRSEISDLKDKLNELRNLLKSHQNEINRIKIRKEQIELDFESTNKKIEDGRKRLSEINKKISALNSEISERESILERVKIDENFFKIKVEIDELDRRIFSIREEILKMKKFEEDYKQFNTIKNELEKSEKDLKEIKNKKITLYNNIEEISMNLKKKEDEIRTLEMAILRLEARKNSIFEAMEIGAKEVLKLRDKIDGIYGTVSELASVKEEFALPLRVACGNKLNYIVVENENVAEKCIEHLRKNRIGIATFLPINRLKKIKLKEIKKSDGVIGLAINLLNYDKKFENVFLYVLGNTLVVKDFETAKRVGIGIHRMVTLDGDLIEKSGVISGGFRKVEVMGFKPEDIEIKIGEMVKLKRELSEEFKKLENSLNEKQDELSTIKEKEKEIEFRINELKRKKEEIEKIGSFDIEYLNKKNEELKILEEKKQSLFKKLEILPISGDEILKIQEELKELKKSMEEMKAEHFSIESSINNVFLREIENLSKIRSNLEKEEINFTEEIKKVQDEVVKTNEALKAKEAEEKKFYEKLKHLLHRRESINKRIEVLQRKKIIFSEKINKLKEKINDLKNEKARISGMLEGLYKRYEEYKGIEIKEVRESVEDINKKIEEIKQKISSIGPPNMRALQIYKEVENEYNELKSRVEKLNEEKSSIMKIIEETDTKKKVAFLETLTKIEENLQRIHSTICPGWEIKLIIEDPQNLFESGIEMRVKEHGKTFTTVRTLSGGQKTMVALSFIFAIQEYQPAPFYVMDEIDAALDKENSDRLAELIKKYAEKSQFIIVSHNDVMLTKSDYLYGVTMKPDGESQVVSLRL